VPAASPDRHVRAYQVAGGHDVAESPGPVDPGCPDRRRPPGVAGSSVRTRGRCT